MRIVVLYALAGGGHLSAAKALKAQLDGPDCEVIPVDSTRPFGRFIDFFCCDLYRFSAKYVPRAFGLCYRLTDRRTGSSRFMRLLAAPLARRLLPVICLLYTSRRRSRGIRPGQPPCRCCGRRRRRRFPDR